VLEMSLREAMGLGHNYIGTEHILLGLIREGEGVGAQVLVTLGADLNRVRQKVVEILSRTPPEDVSQAAAAAVTLTVEDVGAGPSDPPRCPRCATSLTTAAGYRVVEATPETAGEAAAEPVKFVVVVYCKVCGTALGTAS
jgi:ClpA/ClpB-like protein